MRESRRLRAVTGFGRLWRHYGWMDAGEWALSRRCDCCWHTGRSVAFHVVFDGA